MSTIIRTSHQAEGFSEGVQPFIAWLEWPAPPKKALGMSLVGAAFCPVGAIYRALRLHRVWRARIARREAALLVEWARRDAEKSEVAQA